MRARRQKNGGESVRASCHTGSNCHKGVMPHHLLEVGPSSDEDPELCECRLSLGEPYVLQPVSGPPCAATILLLLR